MAKILKHIKDIAKAIWYADCYVIVDAVHDFIHVSKGLYERFDMEYRVSNEIIMFKVNKDTFAFAFSEDADVSQQTDTTKLQAIDTERGKKLIGFVPTPITASRILYDYGLPELNRVKLTVIPHMVKDMMVFTIQPPRIKRQ